MAIPRYFAMTAAEIRGNAVLPPEIAWMACHFSPYGTGLSNLPAALPPGAVLILNDRTPIHGHDPRRIAAQLSDALEANACRALLLDFQRPGEPETAAVAEYLAAALPCPMAVSAPYADGLDCPVFLPPVPPDTSLEAYLSPWQDREVWLEIALEGQIITLKGSGAEAAPLPAREAPAHGTREPKLHCHYRILLSDDQASFPLWRTKEDLEDLLAEAERRGVTMAFGLYQEFFGAEKAENALPTQ